MELGLKRCLFLKVILMSFLVAACSLPAAVPVIPVSEPSHGLRLYLQTLPQEAQNLTLTLADFKAIGIDGSNIHLDTPPIFLQGHELLALQKRLLSAALPPGEYRGLSLRVTAADLHTDEGITSLLVPDEPVVLQQDFRISQEKTLALFLTLEPQRLITDGYRLTPTFSLWLPKPALPELKGFVSNSAAGTLSVFEKRTPQVVSVLSVGRQPQGLVLDAEQRRAYVALAGDDSIAAIDVTNEKIQDKLRLRPGDAPSELALSPDGHTLVAVNEETSSLSILNADPLYEQGRLLLSSSPRSVFFATSNAITYLLQPEINALAMVDLKRQEIIASVNLEFSPIRGAASPDGRTLYLLTADSPNLLVVDSSSLALRDRILVGYGARSLAVNPHNGMVYVGMKSGEVAFVDAEVSLPIDSLRSDGDAAWLSVDTEENALFVVSGRDGRLGKYDLISKKRLGLIETDGGSYAAVLMGD